MAKAPKAPATMKVKPETELWYRREMGGIAQAFNALQAELGRLQERLVREAAKRDRVDLKYWGFNPDTMEWFEVPRG